MSEGVTAGGLITRRTALKRAGGAALMAAAAPLIAACGGGSGGAASNGRYSGELDFMAWSYRPDLYKQQLSDVFEKQYPSFDVKYQAYPVASFAQNMATNFAAGTKMDAIMTRDDLVYAWAKGGQLRALDDLPGAEEYKADLLDYARESLSVDGKLYGLPYLTVFNAFIYNKAMLHKVGIDKPPTTWDQLDEQAVALKREGVVEFPHMLWMQNTPGVNWDFWNYVYAWGGELFDQNNEPVFPDKDPTALNVLEWMLDGIYGKKIIDPGVIALDFESGTQAFAAGRGAFVIMPYSQLTEMLDPKASKISKDVAVGMTPATRAADYPGSSMGYSRMFSMGSSPHDEDAAWKLVQFLGGKDKTGDYHFQKFLWTQLGFGYGYKSLSKDPEVRKATRTYMSPDVFEAGNAHAKRRGALKTSWYSEWDDYNAAQLQDVLRRRVSPRQGLANSAAKAKELAQKA